MSTRAKQKRRILEFLIKNKEITTMDSFVLFGDTRLSDKIYRLKKDGYLFDEEWVRTTNKYGEKVKFKKYIYKGEKENV